MKNLTKNKVLSTILLLNFILFSVNCATLKLPAPPTPPKIEDTLLISSPIEEREVKSLPKKTFGKKVILKDDKSPGDGILLDEHEAAKLALIKAERDRLRTELAAERKLKLKTKYLYDRALWQANVKYLQSQPTFWERHSGKIGLLVGLVVGAALSIGIAAGLDKVSE